MFQNDDSASAEPFFRQAIQLDPNFAMAHLSLGLAHFNLGKKASRGRAFARLMSCALARASGRS